MTVPASLASSSTTVQQSITQSSNSEDNDNLTTSQSSSSSATIINNTSSHVSSTLQHAGSETVPIMQDMSGKIVTTTVINASQPTGLIMGDWSLNRSGFTADFGRFPLNSSIPEKQYELTDFRPYSVQEINNITIFTGTIDVTSDSTTVLEDAGASLLIYEGTMVLWVNQINSEESLVSPIMGTAEE
jgi:hypothetical protein